LSDFRRLAFLDEPPIAGAQWWQDSISGAVSRRATLTALAIAGGLAAVTVAFGAATHACSKSTTAGSGDGEDDEEELRPAIAMQRRFGWSFGANGVALPSSIALRETDPARIDDNRRTLAEDLSLWPPEASLRPFYSAALLEVVTARPEENPSADPTPIQPYPDAYTATTPSGVSPAFRFGAAVARLLAQVGARDTALVVDLPGPDSVAFAAGAATLFSPVLGMPNWPHPLGTVASHHTLSTFVLFRPLLKSREAARPSPAPPLFVLDGDRLRPLVDAALDFDNRYLATLPNAEQLTAMGVRRIYYVRNTRTMMDDVAARLLEYARHAQITLHMLLASEFTPFPSTAPAERNHGAANEALPPRYGGIDREPPLAFGGAAADVALFRSTYLPSPGGTGPRHGDAYAWSPEAMPQVAPPPTTVGAIPVVLAGGLIVGAALAKRRGSWSRAGYGSSGG
jgi:hypothetical protein